MQTQLIKINLPPFETSILEFICQRSNSLYNQAVYYVKQWHYLTHPGNLPSVPYEQMANNLKDEVNYRLLYSQAAQQTLKTVAEGYKSFAALLPMWYRGELPHLENKPSPPQYRKKGGLFQISYPAIALTFSLDSSFVRVPLGNELGELEGIKELFLPCPGNIKPEQIKELTIIPRNGQFYAAYSYSKIVPIVSIDKKKALGIDHGLDNWLTCISNVGTSFIVDGKHLKSLNQWYNKQVSTIKDNKPQGFWNNRLAGITERRNRQMRDAVNKAARLIINHYLKNRIGTIVFGWNLFQKQNANMGKKTNQSFVQIPTAKVKERIKEMCEFYGLQFVETEEAYTSKHSFVDGDELPKYGETALKEGFPPQATANPKGEKPKEYKSSGKRVERGLYRTGLSNWYINADCNGAANILRKVSAMLGLVLDGVCRSALTAPIRLRLWHVLSKKPLHS